MNEILEFRKYCKKNTKGRESSFPKVPPKLRNSANNIIIAPSRYPIVIIIKKEDKR